MGRSGEVPLWRDSCVGVRRRGPRWNRSLRRCRSEFPPHLEKGRVEGRWRAYSVGLETIETCKPRSMVEGKRVAGGEIVREGKDECEEGG